MNRHLVPAGAIGAIITATVALTACAPTEETDTVDDVREAAADLAVGHLPYHADFHFKDPSMTTQHAFDIPQGASLTITADGGWDRPNACPAPGTHPYVITPFRQSGVLGHYTAGLDPRSYPSNGGKHSETWHNVPGGRYIVEISAGSHGPECRLVGTLTITSP